MKANGPAQYNYKGPIQETQIRSIDACFDVQLFCMGEKKKGALIFSWESRINHRVKRTIISKNQ